MAGVKDGVTDMPETNRLMAYRKGLIEEVHEILRNISFEDEFAAIRKGLVPEDWDLRDQELLRAQRVLTNLRNLNTSLEEMARAA